MGDSSCCFALNRENKTEGQNIQAHGGARTNVRALDVDDNFEVYPNPTTNKLTINFAVAASSNINIYLHDINGKVIKELHAMKKYKPGKYSLTIQIEDISPGIYNVVGAFDSERVVRKLVVLK